MTIADSGTALAQVASGEADVAIINRGRARLRDSAITHLDLLSDPLALPLSHTGSNKSKLSLAELATEPWMLATGPACADSEMFQASCRLAGFEAPDRLPQRRLHGIAGLGGGWTRRGTDPCPRGCDGSPRHRRTAPVPKSAGSQGRSDRADRHYLLAHDLVVAPGAPHDRGCPHAATGRCLRCRRQRTPLGGIAEWVRNSIFAALAPPASTGSTDRPAGGPSTGCLDPAVADRTPGRIAMRRRDALCAGEEQTPAHGGTRPRHPHRRGRPRPR